MYALASLRCPLVSAALPAAFAWQAWDLVHCQGSDVRPGVPLVPLGLRRSAGGFCVAVVGLGALPRGRMYALASLRCPLISAALPVAFAWQAWDLVQCQGVYAPQVSLGLRRSAGGFCVAGAALGALQCSDVRPAVSPGVPRCPSGVPWSPPLCCHST